MSAKKINERKQVKKLTIEIVDSEAIFAAYPALNREDFVKTVVDKSKLRKRMRPIVNSLYALEQQVPGVKAYFASEEENKVDPKSGPANAAPSPLPEAAVPIAGAAMDELKDIPAHLKKASA